MGTDSTFYRDTDVFILQVAVNHQQSAFSRQLSAKRHQKNRNPLVTDNRQLTTPKKGDKT